MENFEALQGINDFCKVLVKKKLGDNVEEIKTPDQFLENNHLSELLRGGLNMGYAMPSATEDPFVDILDEGDHIRILVQCRCREQQVTFHPSSDGITICREDCHKDKDGAEKCNDVCRKLSIKTDELQLDNMLFVIAKCTNNNTLEAMIPKMKK